MSEYYILYTLLLVYSALFVSSTTCTSHYLHNVVFLYCVVYIQCPLYTGVVYFYPIQLTELISIEPVPRSRPVYTCIKSIATLSVCYNVCDTLSPKWTTSVLSRDG